MLATMRRFLPYLWPSDAPGLRARIVVAMLLVVVSKLVQVFSPFALAAAVDGMARPQALSDPFTFVTLMVIGYVAGRFGTVFFDNVRNVVFERVGQEATRRLASNVFRHLHQLSLRFHLERRTGAVTKVVERGTKSIDTMLYFLLFNIAPTLFELALVVGIFWVKFGVWLVAGTLVMVVVYIAYTRMVTDWRSKLRQQMNDLDTGAVAHAVDSLLNFETVKYFNAEEREARRYDDAVAAYARAATVSENSLAWLNIGQALLTNLMLAAGMILVVVGWARQHLATPGVPILLTPGGLILVQTLLSQLFRPLDLLGMVYRTIRQGVIDMGAMFDLIDTPSEVVDAADALPLNVIDGHVRFEDVHFAYDPDREILKGIDLDVRPGTTLAVVGPSGAGKSTLARILYRFYDLTGGRDDDRRAGHRPSHPVEPARRDRDRAAGYRAVQRHDRLQHRLWPRGRERGGGCRCRARRGDRGVHPVAAAGVRDSSRRTRAQAFGRREAASRDRADPGQEPADPDPRRSDQRARFEDRGRYPGDARGDRARPHHDRDRASAVHRGPRRPHRRARSRPRRRAAAPTRNCCARAGSTPRCGRGRRRSVKRAKARCRRSS